MTDARATSQLDDREYLQRFQRKIADRRIPFSGSIALTHRCNLDCLHCYLGRQRAAAELTAEQWMALLDQAAEAECLELLITGGEPMIRPDFCRVYAHARERGMLVTVFTNATRVTDAVLDVMADLPPLLVEVSLYGATPETHDRITRATGSFVQCLEGVERLLGRKVRVGLKTILMTANRQEYYGMEALAARYGVKWRLDSAIFGCLPGEDGPDRPSPCSLRVSPGEAVEIECSSERRVQGLRDAHARLRRRTVSEYLYTCGAGQTTFHVDPQGDLHPCLLTAGYRCSVPKHGFAEAWRRIGRIRQVKAPPDFECNRCEKQGVCSGCPAVFDLENGEAYQKSDYICALAGLRYTRLRAGEESPVAHEAKTTD